ncbi:MAG TPA: hypothetical protein DCP91_01385 [Eggerthellaceae bacterium]|nr:hypothetical protein [Eggerthellaceae bacterium]
MENTRTSTPVASRHTGEADEQAQARRRFCDLLYWLRTNVGAGEEALLGVSLYAISMIWNLGAWYVGTQVVRILKYGARADYASKYGRGATGMYDLSCEVRGRFGLGWVDAIAIARIVRDEETGCKTDDLTAWETRMKAENECVVALMERDGIDPAHIDEVRQLLL